MTHPFDLAEQQIRENKKRVDFDIREFTIEHLVYKFKKGDIYVPDYQRDFVWEKDRQSKFIESIILGLPIPQMIFADMSDREDAEKEGQLEIVDGVQRMRTLDEFVNGDLELTDLDLLTTLKNKHFIDFSVSRQRRFLHTSMRMLILSEKSDPDVRSLLFERINYHNTLLTDMEQRKGSYPGPFTDFIYEDCAKNPLFQQLTYFTEYLKKRGEAEELILRFFAYSDQYPNFKSDAHLFLNTYLGKKNKEGFDNPLYRNKFQKMLEFVSKYFPTGFVKVADSKKTPRVRFEAISVGTLLALQAKPDLKDPDMSWLNDKKFIREIIGSSTSTPARIKSRIEYVKTKLLG